MKIVLLLGLGFLLSVAHASTQLSCKSLNEMEGWDGGPTRGYAYFSAKIGSNVELPNIELIDAQVSGVYTTDQRNLRADLEYRPRIARYQKMNRFPVLEDAWCWFTPLLPKTIAEYPLRKKFDGYLQMICEEGRGARTIKLSCQLNE